MVVESRNFHPRCATHLGGKIHDAQATFFPENFPFGADDGGIDQLVNLLLRIFVIDVQDNDSMERPDLIGCQSNPHRKSTPLNSTHSLHDALPISSRAATSTRAARRTSAVKSTTLKQPSSQRISPSERTMVGLISL